MNWIKVWGLPLGLTKEDFSKANGGLKYGVGIQSANQPSDITAVRSNQRTVYVYNEQDEIIDIFKVASMWLMSGDFEAMPWWGDEQATKQVCTDALIAIGIKDVPAIINTIEVLVMNQAEMSNETCGNPLWGETT